MFVVRTISTTVLYIVLSILEYNMFLDIYYTSLHYNNVQRWLAMGNNIEDGVQRLTSVIYSFNGF